MQNNQTAINHNHSRNDWDFVPTVLVSSVGIAIGIAIGNFLGWV